jgi:hypothetical protein
VFLGKSFNSTKTHVNPCGIGPTKILFFKPGYFHYLQYCCNYCPFHYFDLGMKIPNGIGGLGKSFHIVINPHVNP